MASTGIINGATDDDLAVAAPAGGISDESDSPVMNAATTTTGDAANTTAEAANTATTTPTSTTPTVAAYQPVEVATPTQWNVTGDQTVAGQVNSLINENSPLIEQARTNAKQQMNARGLVNSAMGISAGETAAYNAALPIATADAATQAKAAGYNVDQINQAGQLNAQSANTAGQFNAAAINDATLQQMAEKNSTLLNTNQQAASLMGNATTAINAIMNNNEMDATTKTEAARQVYENLNTQLQIIGSTSGLDLSSLLGENPYDATGFSNDPSPAVDHTGGADVVSNIGTWIGNTLGNWF